MLAAQKRPQLKPAVRHGVPELCRQVEVQLWDGGPVEGHGFSGIVNKRRVERVDVVVGALGLQERPVHGRNRRQQREELSDQEFDLSVCWKKVNYLFSQDLCIDLVRK